MILGVIPARGGSKGIPRKNLYPCFGKPLIQWTIEAAAKSTLLDRCVVSTEDVEIAEVSEGLGAEVLTRPEKLAADDATTVAVLEHITNQLTEYDTIVLLEPTSPIRPAWLIDDCIRRFRSMGCDTLATVVRSRSYEWGTKDNEPRQTMEAFPYDTGNIYVHRAAHLRRGQWWGKVRCPYVVESPGCDIGIDSIEDVWMVEGVMARLA